MPIDKPDLKEPEPEKEPEDPDEDGSLLLSVNDYYDLLMEQQEQM